jgi:hypothetical protein
MIDFQWNYDRSEEYSGTTVYFEDPMERGGPYELDGFHEAYDDDYSPQAELDTSVGVYAGAPSTSTKAIKSMGRP